MPIALIPARYASTRFPGKPLALLGGKTVIERVCRQVSKAGMRPVVATDNSLIASAVDDAGFESVMTSPDHRSGTDRIAEALSRLADVAADEIVLNVQGDEPFIRPGQLLALADAFRDPEVRIATLVKRFDPSRGFEALRDPNLVKVVRSAGGDALYFSRSTIPYVRGADTAGWLSEAEFFTHIGVYAFRSETLRAVAALPRTRLEIAESLEQLRWLENGFRIRTVATEGDTVGIDTPADLEEAEKALANLGEIL